MVECGEVVTDRSRRFASGPRILGTGVVPDERVSVGGEELLTVEETITIGVGHRGIGAVDIELIPIRDMVAILELTLGFGQASVLNNGKFLRDDGMRRLRQADDVIVNDADLPNLERQVRALHKKYLALAAQES